MYFKSSAVSLIITCYQYNGVQQNRDEIYTLGKDYITVRGILKFPTTTKPPKVDTRPAVEYIGVNDDRV